MERKELDFVLAYNHYIKGGTKEACIKVREFLRCVTNPENQISSESDCVTAEEFVESVKTLLVFSFQQEDQIPEKWHCEYDCRKVSDFLCPGECAIDDSAKKLCPFFMDEGLI